MKSFSSLLCCLVLALSAAGCWVPELPDDALFSCDTAADCAAEGVVCVSVAGQRGYCCTPTAEVCNSLDDDCDGKADEDFNLQSDITHCGGCGKACDLETQRCNAGSCVARGELVCDDGIDNDGTEGTDCADPDCDNQARTCNPGETEKNCACIGRQLDEAACGDGVDNDGDGFTDCVEVECSNKSCGTGCVCENFIKKELACTDGTDNDGDTKADCADTDCNGQSCGNGCTCTAGVKKELACTDGTDNDGDTKTDCADTDCNGQSCGTGCICSAGVKKENSCTDRADNDGDGQTDCADRTDCPTGTACTRNNGNAGTCQSNGSCN